MQTSVESSVATKRADRRVALLRRMGLFGDGLAEVAIARATTMDDLAGAYGLVHDAFVDQGYIERDWTGLRMRPYEALPETATFIARHHGDVIGVSGLITDSSDLGVPSDHVFGDEIEAIRGSRRIVCEITNQAVSTAWRGTTVATELMRCLYAHALAIGCTDLICVVNPGHAKFYGLIGFSQIGDVRSYSDVADDPVVLMHAANIAHRFDGIAPSESNAEGFLRKFYVDENHYRRYVESWDMVAERLFLDPVGLHELFVTRSRLLEKCSGSELGAIRWRWGAEIFDEVSGGKSSVKTAQLGAA